MESACYFEIKPGRCFNFLSQNKMLIPFVLAIFMRAKHVSLYIAVIEQELLAPDRCAFLMSYLKVHPFCCERAGTFTKEIFIKANGLHNNTALNHISKLIEKGFVRKLSPNRYQIISLKKIFGIKFGSYYLQIPLDKLNSYSWKNIRSFRAFLLEAYYEQIEILKKKFRTDKEYTRTNWRDKSKEKVLNERFLESKLHHKISLLYGKRIFGFAYSTLSRYRTAQTDVTYTWKPFVVYDYKKAHKSWKLVKKIENFTGRAFPFGDNGNVFYSPISTRVSRIELVKHKPFGKAFGRFSKTEDISQTIDLTKVPF